MFDNVTSRYDLSDATIEVVIMLLVAFLLGALLGYLLCKQYRKEDEKQAKPLIMPSDNHRKEVTHSRAITDKEVISDDWKPKVLDAPIGDPDDLKRISGIGSVIEKTLHDLGIFHYKQIAELNSNNVKWLDDYIDFPGRINRENWIGQAKDLMTGVATDFANRYDKNQTQDNRNKKPKSLFYSISSLITNVDWGDGGTPTYKIELLGTKRKLPGIP